MGGARCEISPLKKKSARMTDSHRLRKSQHRGCRQEPPSHRLNLPFCFWATDGDVEAGIFSGIRSERCRELARVTRQATFSQRCVLQNCRRQRPCRSSSFFSQREGASFVKGTCMDVGISFGELREFVASGLNHAFRLSAGPSEIVFFLLSFT